MIVPSDAATQKQAIGRIARKGQTIDPYVFILEPIGLYCDPASALAAITSSTKASGSPGIEAVMVLLAVRTPRRCLATLEVRTPLLAINQRTTKLYSRPARLLRDLPRRLQRQEK